MDKERINVEGSKLTFMIKTVNTSGRDIKLYSRDGKRWDSNPKLALLFSEREKMVLKDGTAHNSWGNLTNNKKKENPFNKFPFRRSRRL